MDTVVIDVIKEEEKMNLWKRFKNAEEGYSLVELIIVVAILIIIAILVKVIIF